MYPAEFGGKASALINVATRAGANAFAAALFEFRRNDAFDARNYFDAGGPAGAAAAAEPVRRRRSAGRCARDRSVLLRQLRRAADAPVADADVLGADRRPRAAAISPAFAPICDPLTIDPATGACTPFAGNRIPADRIDPIAAAFLQHVPLPTSGAAAAEPDGGRASRSSDVDQVSVRLDHRFGRGDQLFARFSTFDADEIQPFGTSALQETLVPGFGRDARRPRPATLGVSHTRVFGSSVLNELRVGWMRVTGGQVSENRGVDFAGQVGLQGVTTRSARRRLSADLDRAGSTARSATRRRSSTANNQHFELYDNVTLDRGAHRAQVRRATTSTCSCGPSSPTTRAAPSPTPGSSAATRSPISCSATRRRRSSGIGRGDEDGRTNWLHALRAGRLAAARQPDAQPRPALRVQPAHARREQPAVVGRSVGARRPLRDRQRRRRRASTPSAQALLPLMPIPYVTSAEAGMGARPARARARCAWRRARASRWSLDDDRGRRPRRLRHLPEPVGLQRADGVRAQPAVLLHQAGRRAGRRRACRRFRRATS